MRVVCKCTGLAVHEQSSCVGGVHLNPSHASASSAGSDVSSSSIAVGKIDAAKKGLSCVEITGWSYVDELEAPK